MQLRDFQIALMDRTRASLRKHRRTLIQLPTGGGKTVVATFIAKGVVSRGKRLWFNCHRDFLVDQTTKTFEGEGLKVSHIAAGMWFNPWHPVHVNMVQTLTRRVAGIIAKHGAPDYVIWDEAHHVSASTWASIMAAMPETTRHIGLSATPQRLDGKGLDEHFDDLVIGPSTAELIAAGWLSDYRMFAPSEPDMAGAHHRMGDFTAADIDAAMQKVVVGDIVNHYQRLARGLRAVYFSHSVARSKRLAMEFSMKGIPALHLDGTSPKHERRMAARAFARGDLFVISNVDLFGEGYDLAAQADMDVTVEAVGLCRPTESLALHLQQIGRALRPKERPAIILDHAGNWRRHGLPDDERQWSLKGIERSEPPEAQQCRNCLAIIRAEVVICPVCGERVKEATTRSAGGGRPGPQMVDGELEEITREDRRRMRAASEMEERQCTSVWEFQDLAKRRGIKDPLGWAAYMFTLMERRKREPRQEGMRLYE